MAPVTPRPHDVEGAPAALLADLRARGVWLRDDERGRLVVRPASLLSDDERALVRERAEAVLALLREERRATGDPDVVVFEPTVDALLRAEREAEEAALARSMAPPPPVVMFRTRRGILPLKYLDLAEVRALEARGRITPDEVREWVRVRRPRPPSSYVGEVPEFATALLGGWR